MREETHKPARGAGETRGGNWLTILGSGVPAVLDYAGAGWGGPVWLQALSYLWGIWGLPGWVPGSTVRVSQIRREVFGDAQRGHVGVSAGILQKSLVGTVQPNPLTFENL